MAKINEEGALWAIFGYLISGLLIWGGIGYFLDKWLMPAHHYFALGGLLRSVVAPLLLVTTVVGTYLASLGISWVLFTQVLGFERLDNGVPLLAFVFLSSGSADGGFDE